ncbi:hypothetical protein BDY21DRAFT_356441 [Lineolata rhizophorae]|uniref:Uncharacterized protein n=1 Tax=Lineolata rhizophorae TaxID=578093 RepID=A0A6A6NNR8_9PEZI|nr:hypothetical protein BDY21DRAFT_356441 [Lineolata rhizophorae]
MLIVEWNKKFRGDGVMVWGADPGRCHTGLGGFQPSAEQVKAMGLKPPEEGAEPVMQILRGEWDGNVGKVISHEGVRPW